MILRKISFILFEGQVWHLEYWKSRSYHGMYVWKGKASCNTTSSHPGRQ